MYKITHIGYFHSDRDIRIVEKECKTLLKSLDCSVRYITSDRNSSNKKYDDNGINIKVLSTINKRFIRLFKYLKILFEEVTLEEVDLCHIHEFTLYPLVKKLKKRNIKVILDLHENDVEDISEQFTARYGKYIGKIIRFLLIKYEKKAISLADAVISVSPQIIDRVKQYGKPTELIPNYPLLTSDDYSAKKEGYVNKDNKICFAGGVAELWSHEYILKAIEGLDVEYLLAGRTEEPYIETLEESSNWNKVKYYGVIPFEDVKKEIYQKSTIGMALMQYDGSWIGTTGTLGNTKLFEFMSYGLPVICTDFTMWREIVADNDCGIMVDPTDIEAIHNGIKFLMDNKEKAYEMGQRGKAAIKNKYNWNSIAVKLVDLYKKILN